MARSSTSFQAGNFSAVRHGTRSPRLVALNRQVVARKLHRQLKERTDAPLVALAIDATTRFQMLADYLDREGGLLTPRGRVRQCATTYLALLRQLVNLYDRLGLGRQVPTSPDDDLVSRLMGGGS